MYLLHLEYFKELAYHENVQETARLLHVSASCVSAGVRHLEEELGCSLFDRVGRNIRLNDFGRQFLPYVEQVFSSLSRGLDELDAARLQQKNRMSFSLRDAAFWNNLIMEFHSLHPEILIRQMDSDPDDRGKIMDLASLDFIMTDKDLDNDTLRSCVLYEDYFVLAVPKSHPLAKDRGAPRSIFEFQRDTFLYRPRRDHFQQCVDRLLARIGFKPHKIMEFEYFLRPLMLERVHGVVITTARAAMTESYDNSAVLRVAEFEGIPQAKKIYWKKCKPLSPAAASFLAFLKEAELAGNIPLLRRQQSPFDASQEGFPLMNASS
ncbi:MAG: LysR family transcriptional regulator [Clostridiales Family XIII bacterium]|jgi:DNA-binding transcriptional LysR family regulator|nr:LysR family transcriptional regulator [Clostridiales Family XIII bacterium]